ncbi:DNA-processing protein DprA [Abyssogena phaseoliformis symbiont]|uniref:DNA-processing protein DprA n=1 Tax=Abyssogena phaseoliformis symbiont TaxID=596095 RepID=UPI001CEC9944|nr:DNA-processing protein DprA [Abyssogena phaseoliformis symbiont]
MLTFLQQADKALVQADTDWTKNENCHVLTLIDEKYPEQLKTISDLPPLLYVRGDVGCLSKPQLAIVGSRNLTSGGAHTFAFELSKLGMASGIDAKAHIGALDADAQTIAVCGMGLIEFIQ